MISEGGPVSWASKAGPWGQAWTPTWASAFLGRRSLGQSHVLSWLTPSHQHRVFQTRHQRPVAQGRLRNYSARLFVACTHLPIILLSHPRPQPFIDAAKGSMGPTCPTAGSIPDISHLPLGPLVPQRVPRGSYKGGIKDREGVPWLGSCWPRSTCYSGKSMDQKWNQHEYEAQLQCLDAHPIITQAT